MFNQRKFQKVFLLSIVLMIAHFATAQKKQVETKADLPVVKFPTEPLQKNDTASVNSWMVNTAAIELKHLDSIYDNYTISDIGMQITFIRTRSLLNFILGNWQELSNAGSAFKNISEADPAFRKAGISELAAYAKAKLQNGSDFNSNYLAVLTSLLDTLTETEKQTFLSYTLSKLNIAKTGFDKERKKASENPVISDTSMYNLLKHYVYGKLNNNIGKEIRKYVNQDILKGFTHADTLRGTITPERAWWDVLRYDITVQPDYNTRTITGKNVIQYKVISDSYPAFMQIDLQEPMIIDSVLFNSLRTLTFTKNGNAWLINVPKQKKASVGSLLIYFHGKPREAVNPPWDGGWIWTKDSLNNPWMSVACQGLGASVWYPCKDNQADEPDNGASLSVIVPDTLVAVANGRLQLKKDNKNGTATYKWAVINPINNYDIIPYIGKYVNFSEVYAGEKGKLDLNYWVLNYNLARAKAHMPPQVHRMLKALEHWYGHYPFYEDGYKLVDAPHLGMEHQSAVAYGNIYMNGYLGKDLSGSGWGLKWDYIIVHESGHEWFGNSITSKDIADMWVHEGFTMFGETLFTDYWYGKEAGNEYSVGIREDIQNNFPILGFYGVNDDISLRNGDMYYKGSNLLQNIRHSIDNDEKFREILIGLNTTFYHKTVTSLQVENYIDEHAGFDFSKVFNQYLRTAEIPVFQFYFSNDSKTIFYRYTNCNEDFNLPLVLKRGAFSLRILPGTKWKSAAISAGNKLLFDPGQIEKAYYLTAEQSTGK